MKGYGRADAKIMVISEAPTSAEDNSGKIVWGRPRELLDELLQKAGFDLKEVYFTRAVRCYPPEARSPTARELKACRPYIDEEIDLLKPQLIISLGAPALKSLMGKSKITELHGQLVAYRGVPLIPTFHPAAALRDPARLPSLRKDIMRAAHFMAGNIVTEDELHWQVIRNQSDLKEFLKEFDESEEVSVDIETTGLNRKAEGSAINSIQFGLASGKNWSLPLNVRDSWLLNRSTSQKSIVRDIVKRSRGKTIVGQNFKFDNLWIKEKYGVKFHLTFDTMLAHHTLDENSPHDLKSMATEFCNAPNYDVDLKTKLGLGELEPFYKYGCFDVFYTLQLYYLFRAQLLKQPTLRRLFYRLVMPAARLFEDVEEDGLFLRMDQHAETERDLVGRRNRILAKMNKMAGGAINWNSPAQIGKLFYEKLEMPILEKTPAGRPSTSEHSLLQLQEHHELPKLLMEYRSLEKNLTTYIQGWKGMMHGDRLYLSTKLHGTVTGRYSSRLHQVPRDPMIRSLIDAPKGWVHVSADYSQIELRLAAMMANEPRMKLAFQTGQDIHSITASEVLGRPIESLDKEDRKMAKPVNFGFLYGMGWKKFRRYALDNYGVVFSDSEAKKYRQRFFEIFKALPPWHERQRRTVRMYGEVTSYSGRTRRLPGVYSSEEGIRAEAERQGINSPVQGFGSGDLKAMAMIEVSQTFDRDLVQIKGEVHDSILMWVREDVIGDIIPQIKDIMENPKLLEVFKINLTVPLVADFEIGPWGKGKPWSP